MIYIHVMFYRYLLYCSIVVFYIMLYFTFFLMHLADAFIQSDLQYIQVIHFHLGHYVCSLGIEPTTFALLTQCSTTEQQEHVTCHNIVCHAMKYMGTRFSIACYIIICYISLRYISYIWLHVIL